MNFKIILVSAFLFTGVDHLMSQASGNASNKQVFEYFDSKYGVDPELVNGIKYVNLYRTAKGTPFLINEEMIPGWVIINGKKYQDLELNYDVYNQDLVMSYYTNLLGSQKIIIPNQNLESFGFTNREFRKIVLPGKNEHIYEIMLDGKYKIYYEYSRNYTVNTNPNDKGYMFSALITEKYLYNPENNTYQKFKNSRSFRKLFQPEIARELKLTEKKYRISLKDDNLINHKLLYNFLDKELSQ